ncbi:MAG: hypothetical protein ABI775_13655 [Pseudonocardiales bacterium]
MSKALRSLQPAERDELLHAMLLGQLSSMARLWPSGVSWPVPLGADIDRDRLVALLGSDDYLPATGRGPLKVLPVRLPETDYERLREFCQARGFSMAVVIRTLLERFLDDHASDSGRA